MAEYSIAELAARCGVPARTVRYYQSVGLVPKPTRHGKEVVYTVEHEQRLQLIADLQGRGLRLDAIGELLHADARARNSAADWLGLDDLRAEPWAHSHAHKYTDNELSDLLGDRRPEIIDDLIAEDYVQFRGGYWHIPDFPLFKGALVLYESGTTIAVSAALKKLMRTRIAALVDELVALLTSAAGAGYAGEAAARDLTQHMERFRAAAWESTGYVVAEEIERAVAELDR